MTAVPPRAATPRLKGPPIASTATDSATGFNSLNTPARPVSPAVILPEAPAVPPPAAAPSTHPDEGQNTSHLAPRRPARPPPADPLSDKATLYLIRRTLCADNPREKGTASPAPVEDLLPPLTTRNDVDVQLYAFVSIIMREFVQNWYNQITPDQSFVAEIVHIIAHITRALEQRLRNVDLEHLLFQELPELLDNHINAYRAAHRRIDGRQIQSDPRQVYHSFFPLPHLSPVPDPKVPGAIVEQEENEANYRQLLVQGVLAVLLPTEDLENECLTSLVGQILSELIIGGIIAKKASEPWLLWEGITILAKDLRSKRNTGDEGNGPGGPSLSCSPTPSTSEMESHADRTMTTTGLVDTKSATRTWSIQGPLWDLIHWVFLGYTIIRFLVSTAISSRSLPSRVVKMPASSYSRSHKGGMTGQNDSSKTCLLEHGRGPVKRPVLSFEMWSCISNLLELDSRMPWLCGVASWAQWMAITGPGQIANLDGTLDRLLSHFINNKLLDPASIPPMLRILRGALFPNNAPGTPTLFPPGSEEALLKLRRKCARAVWELVPRSVGRVVFAGTVRAIPQLTGTSAANRGRHVLSDPARTVGSRSPPLDGDEKHDEAADAAAASGKNHKAGKGKRDGPNQQSTPSPTTTTITATAATPSSMRASKKGKKAGPKATVNRKVPGQGGGEGKTGLPVVTNPVAQGEAGKEAKGGERPDQRLDEDIQEGEEERGLNEVDRVVIDEIEMSVVDVFGDVYCNKHLMYSVLELVLVRLLPELGEKGVAEIWEERLG